MTPSAFIASSARRRYLKARLNEANISFTKTHDLGLLLKLVLPVEPLWLVMDADLKRLTDFAVAARYPGTSTNNPAAIEAFATCHRLRLLARSSFGL